VVPDGDPDLELPIKLGPCSNGEYLPRPLGDVEREFGYPALTAAIKRKVLGLNSARIYDVKPVVPKCTFTETTSYALALRSPRLSGPTDPKRSPSCKP
jgi:hypothetical protein